MRLKAGQKVWFINHTLNEVREGVVESLDDTSVVISEERPGVKYVPSKVSADAVFATKEEAQISLKRKIHLSIREHKEEINRLGAKLNRLEEEMSIFHSVYHPGTAPILASQTRERILRRGLISSF